MAKKIGSTRKAVYKTPRLISFVEHVRKGRGYCSLGSSDGSACSDGSAPAYCTNGTVHTDPWCTIGNSAASICFEGSSGPSF